MADDNRVNSGESSDNAPPSLEVYSILTKWEKRAVVAAISIVAFVGPLATNIYMPVLHTVAQDLRISTTQVNLTITVYLVIQGVGPIFIAPVSDVIGRRITCISGLILFTTASFGLALQNGYAGLLALRCIQSLGASAIASIASAVVADIVVPAERGSFMGFTMIGPILGPSLSPVLGGLVSQYGNWRVIFWALTGFGALLSLLVTPFLPETCRAVVGNGSYTPALYQDSYSNWRMRRRQPVQSRSSERKSFNLMSLFGMLAVVSDLTSVLILLLSGFVSAGFWCVTTSLPTEYVKIYHFDDLMVGLCYLPMAAGGLLVTVVIGKWDPIDRNYRRQARRLGISFQENTHQDMPNFASQKARIEVATPLLLASIMLAVAYGWSLESRVSVAGPQVLLFALSFCMMGMGKVIQILLIDIHSSRPATAVAAFNVAKSLLGAAMTAASAKMIESIGNGWTYTAIGGSWLWIYPIILLFQKYRSDC